MQDVAYNQTTRDKVLDVCHRGGAASDPASLESLRLAGCAPLIFFFYEYGRQSSVPAAIDVAQKLYWYAATNVERAVRLPGVAVGAAAELGRPVKALALRTEPGSEREVRRGATAMGQLENLRLVNRASVVDVLRRRTAVSRSQLVQLTGLSRTTVASVVADLQARGLVGERRDDRGGVPGRARPAARCCSA